MRTFQYASLLYMHGETRLATGSKSSGPGLVIAKIIIDAHAGKIRMERGIGKEAKFCFILRKSFSASGDRQ